MCYKYVTICVKYYVYVYVVECERRGGGIVTLEILRWGAVNKRLGNTDLKYF